MTTNVNPIFVDTNIITRATILSAPLHAEAQATLNQFRADGHVLWISHQILREYAANASRSQTYSQPIPKTALLIQIEQLRNTFQVAEDTTKVLEQFLKLVKQVEMGGNRSMTAILLPQCWQIR